MTRWVALLRGVNVGGHRRVPMADRAAEPALLHVLFLSAVPVRLRTDHVADDEEVRPDGREVWFWYGRGAGHSRLRVEAPDVVATARNWRTVQSLASMASG